MEKHRTRESVRTEDLDGERSRDEIAAATRRLNRLVELNAEFERRASQAAVPAAYHRSPVVGYEEAFSFFGLCMGILPSAAFFLRFATESSVNDFGVFLLLALLVGTAAGAFGFVTGKFVGKAVKQLDEASLPARLLQLPFLGMMWGMIAGIAGGATIFIFGAIPGAVIGAAVGFAAFPVFAILHSAIRHESGIEKRHLYPAALGVTGTVAAAMLGFTI